MAANSNINNRSSKNFDVNSMIDEQSRQRQKELRQQYSKNKNELKEQIALEKQKTAELKEQVRLAQERQKYEKASLLEKQEMVRNELKITKEKAEQARLASATIQASADATDAMKKASEAAVNELQQRIDKLTEQQQKLEKAVEGGKNPNSTLAQKYAARDKQFQDAQNKLSEAKKDKENKLANAETDEEKNAINAEFNKVVEGLDFGLGDIGNNLVKTMVPVADKLDKIFNVANAIHDTMNTQVDAAMDLMSTYTGRVNARLQGLTEQSGIFNRTTQVTFTSIQEDVNDILTGNPYVKQTQVLSNIAKLTESGIGFNLEQRALIETLSDKLVTTFDALDANLTRLIRLQQADLTESQLGAEAQLTQFLNNRFLDTSYLNGVYDSVASAIIDSASTMNRDNATAYEYAVQKWLGALYSVGLSEAAISTIASGLNMLGTGDVSGLTSNNSLQTLFALSAQRAGVSYTDVLTNGLSSNSVNELMKAMVEYLGDIADNTSNQVTKAAYGNIMNMSMSDLRAIQNLTTQDITAIYGSNLTYASAISEYKNQIKQVSARTTISEKINNVIDNLLYTFGSSVADDAEQYIAWKATDVVKDIANMFGGEDSSTSNSLLSKAVEWITGAGNTLNVASALIETFWNFGNSLLTGGIGNGFGWSEFQERGKGFGGVGGSTSSGVLGSIADAVGSIVTGLSYSAATTVGTSTGDKSLISFAQNEKKATLSGSTIVSSDNVATVRTVSDIYAQLFDNSRSINVNVTGIGTAAADTISAATYSGERLKISTNITEQFKSLLDSLDMNSPFYEELSSTISSVHASGTMGRYTL